ncbi:arylamine N-acetyltransferase [Rufibacter glacialis]|uniref:Arylamine N-acetyltransferase n=1 Tax=Rufibacter glacialis TaxID=1259555 RepID=A0A5M8QJH3_9BACT|nr:arylamine N-acetyltransferase [Rufibacter glacialis]KAA6434482.1 arylamine N-acetyltransferase [Rufibacter glacialis]GGK70020.1 acetyltransferase [Rufibacter glacialis]
MNNQRYLNRINYKEQVAVNKKVLFGLQAAHLLNVPFENLDIHYHKPITLEAASIFEKMVDKKRGGFCYELNGLFYQLLKNIGFDVQMISARVYTKNGTYGEEYDHLALLAKVEGNTYLVDVGFGKFSFQPLEVTPHVVLPDPYGLFTFDIYQNDYWRINTLENNTLMPQYIFKNTKREFSEFKGMCQFHQTSQESPFTQKKVVSMATTSGRITLNDTQLKITEGDTETKLEFEEALFLSKLKEYFHIEV